MLSWRKDFVLILVEKIAEDIEGSVNILDFDES